MTVQPDTGTPEAEDRVETMSEQSAQAPGKGGFVLVIQRTTFNYVVIAIAFLISGILIGTAFNQRAAGSEVTVEMVSTAVAAAVSNSLRAQATASPAAPAKLNVSADDDPSWGPPNAPVTIIEFSDFQCPFCGRFHQDTYDQIRQNYAGKIRFVYRDFPIVQLHPYAEISAQTADCVNEQGKFWPYHDLLLSNQDIAGARDLRKFAAQLELDMSQYDNCVATQRYQQEVAKDLQDGANYGVQGTPTFFINGQPLVGAQPYAVFASVIDAELARAVQNASSDNAPSG